ncbi:MAG: DUF362 domain-containing protein [Kofleriaceae bacterium]|jgi:hypothetical protein|nr:DUF362 domain-containing protein [Kofleriaceae bacterium]MBP9206211.1 DUF362 domain-containing protein [Kofleriaceae bacterium]
MSDATTPRTGRSLLTRRTLLLGGGAGLLAAGGAAFVLRKKLLRKLDQWTILPAFAATPDLLPHDPVKDRATLAIGQGAGPAANVDAALSKLGGIGKVVGVDDVVIIKVSAQWWNQGMTNVAAVRRTIEHILELPGFKGEVVVFENTHFHVPDKAADDPSRGLTRAFTHPSEVNVDVPGWTKLGDLIPHFAGLGAPVSFVGLVDAGGSSLSGDPWFDPEHTHGVYGGDERGPLRPGDTRDGYHWDFSQVFSLKRSRVASARTPLSWPRFTSPRSGLVIDLKDGVLRRDGAALVATGRPLKFINMTTGNEHGSTGFTGACKSAMGILDMSAGALGTHPLIRDYQSVHYFGRTGRPHPERDPTWRMAGPLAFWSQRVRKPDLYLTVAEWTAYTPKAGYDERDDMRHHPDCRAQTKTVVAGVDPVAIDAWCVRNLVRPLGSKYDAMLDLDTPDSKVSKFLRYYRQVAGAGTLDAGLVTLA